MEDKGVHTFSLCICPKVNIRARLEFEIAYYDSAVQSFNHYAPRAPPKNSWEAIPQKEFSVKNLEIKNTFGVESKDELISDVFPWTPSHRRAKTGRPARSYLQQPCTDTRCSLEDLPGAMDDRDKWRVRAREIRASSTMMMMMSYIELKLFFCVRFSTDTLGSGSSGWCVVVANVLE